MPLIRLPPRGTGGGLGEIVPFQNQGRTRNGTIEPIKERDQVDIEKRVATQLPGNRLNGKVHKTISNEQAKEAAKAIASYREVQRLLARWERETVRIITTRRSRKA